MWFQMPILITVECTVCWTWRCFFVLCVCGLIIDSGFGQWIGNWCKVCARQANCEEIASVLFSIGNSLATIIGYWAATGRKGRSLQSSYKARDDFYAKVVRTHAFVCALVWLFSAQFHARDTLVAERLDYFGAALMLYLTLYLTLWRNFPTYKNTLQLAVLVAYW